VTFSGLYINLERSADRRQRLEAELSCVGLQYQRLPASDGRVLAPGKPAREAAEYGCYLSHCRAMEIAATDDKPTHILEDDAKLSLQLPVVIQAAIAGRLLDQFDIVFLDVQMPYAVAMWRHLRNAIRPGQVSIVNLSGATFAALASYLVSPSGAAKVRELCIAEYSRKPFPIDLIIRDQAMAGKLRVGTLIPFATTLHLSDATRSTIGESGHAGDDFMLAMMLLRYSFFIEADPVYVAPFIQRLRSRRDGPGKAEIHTVLDFLQREMR
jgi:Glycosyltransferase family 25 (LPS biosynthesis protein)